MSLRRNSLLAVGGSAWSALLGIGTVPIYVHFLGVENYALIGVLGMMQSISVLIDFGLPQSIGRAIASGRDRELTPSLVRTLEYLYVASSAIIALVVFSSAHLIASSWLTLEKLTVAEVAQDIRLMGLVIAVRWPIALYQSVLVGFGRIGSLSALTAAMATASTLACIVVVAFGPRTMAAFFITQAFFSVIHVVIARFLAKGNFVGFQARFNLQAISSIAKFSAAMAGVTVSAAMLSQADRFILTHLLPLSDFGYYVLGATVVGSLYLVITPVFNIIYPHLTALHASGKTRQLEQQYLLGTKLLVATVFPIAVLLAVSGNSLVYFWTGSSVVAERVGPLVSLMSMGSALHGAMYFPYALQLAMGRPLDAFRTNLVLLCMTIPTTLILVTSFGLIGGALSWLIFQIMYLLIGSFVVRNYLRSTSIRRWLFGAVLVPAFICWSVIAALSVCGVGSYGYMEKLAIGIFAMFGSFVALKLFFGISIRDAQSLMNTAPGNG